MLARAGAVGAIGRHLRSGHAGRNAPTARTKAARNRCARQSMRSAIDACTIVRHCASPRCSAAGWRRGWGEVGLAHRPADIGWEARLPHRVWPLVGGAGAGRAVGLVGGWRREYVLQGRVLHPGDEGEEVWVKGVEEKGADLRGERPACGQAARGWGAACGQQCLDGERGSPWKARAGACARVPRGRAEGRRRCDGGRCEPRAPC